MGSFISQESREDMQSDTFSLVASLIEMCLAQLINKDLERLHDSMKALMVVVHMRLPPETRANFEALTNQLYGEDSVLNDVYGRSSALDNATELLMEITTALDKEGILFKEKTDLDALTAQTSV